MSQSSVPVPAFGPRGFVSPDDQDVLNGVLADMSAAFGGNLNLNLSTPQGQWAMTLAAAIMSAYEIFEAIANGVDPAYADGRMQDAIARIYFLTRNPATSTQVTCTCTGATPTVIPAGALAQDTSGNLYGAVSGGVIPAGGSIALQFAALEVGPTPCPAGSLTVIYQAINGWDSITNAADGVLGNLAENRTAFENRRQQTVEANAVGPSAAVQGAVLKVPGVADAFTIDNPTNGTVTVRGVAIAAHSIYCCVNGGSDQAVAQAIASKKAPGCPYVGTTTVTTTDQSPGYSPPYPSYTVKFTRAAALPVFFAVSIANGPSVPSDAVAQIQSAVLNAWAGGDGGLRPTIGSTIWALRFASAISALGPWVQLESLAIGTTMAPTGASVGVHIDQVPTTAAANTAVTLV